MANEVTSNPRWRQLISGTSETPWLYVAILCTVVAIPMLLGHHISRAAQIFVLFLPTLTLLTWRPNHYGQRNFTYLIALLLVSLFIIDGLIRQFLWQHFGASANSMFILAAVANITLFKRL